MKKIKPLTSKQRKFCEEHIEFTESVAGAFCANRGFNGEFKKEIFSEAYQTLIKCVNGWNLNLGEFKPYVSTAIHRNLWRMIFKNNRDRNYENLDITTEMLNYKTSPDIEIEEYIEKLSIKLSSREKQVINFYFYEEMFQFEIAKKLHISKSAVSKFLRRGIKKMQNRQKASHVSKESLLSSF